MLFIKMLSGIAGSPENKAIALFGVGVTAACIYFYYSPSFRKRPKFNIEELESFLAQESVPGIQGLENIENYCFMNVILQCQASSPSFVEWLEDVYKEVGHKSLMIAELLYIIKRMNFLSHFTNQVNFMDTAQHDSLEFYEELHHVFEKFRKYYSFRKFVIDACKLPQPSNPEDFPFSSPTFSPSSLPSSSSHPFSSPPFSPFSSSSTFSPSVTKPLQVGAKVPSLSSNLRRKLHLNSFLSESSGQHSWLSHQFTIATPLGFTQKDSILPMSPNLGVSQTKIVCSGCRHCEVKTDSFSYLSLPINAKGANDIFTCLNSYFEPEHLENYKCDNCKVVDKCYRRLKIVTFPQLLVIHFQRLTWTNDGLIKLTQKIHFPSKIYLDKFMLHRLDEKRFVKGYHLVAVVVHVGNERGGHYISYRLGPSCKKWYRISDLQYTQVSEKMVLNVNAYMLYYEKSLSVNLTSVSEIPKILKTDSKL